MVKWSARNRPANPIDSTAATSPCHLGQVMPNCASLEIEISIRRCSLIKEMDMPGTSRAGWPALDIPGKTCRLNLAKILTEFSLPAPLQVSTAAGLWVHLPMVADFRPVLVSLFVGAGRRPAEKLALSEVEGPLGAILRSAPGGSNA